MSTSLPSPGDLPRIDIIFVVRFDAKRGNVLEWASENEEDLSGIEFSALPSGLHNVSSDVIYFRHREYVGISAYVSVAIDSVADRGALMAAVGVLSKPRPDSGRCGQVWRHASFLQSQAKRHVQAGADTSALEDYWRKSKVDASDTILNSVSASRKRDSYRALNPRRVNRSFTLSEPLILPHMQHPSTISELELSTEDIHPSHPSHHVLEFIHQMGPAIFVIWKAALLKKRIMICASTPVEAACLAVYNTCLLATIPLEATHIAMSKSNERIQPLFCVGTHDIEKISKLHGGYVACTTDALFRYKPELYDYLVELPGHSSTAPRNSPRNTRPSISVPVKSTEGGGFKLEKMNHNLSDSRRYILLLRILSRHRRQQEWFEHRRSLDQQQQQQQQQTYASAQEYEDQLESDTAQLLNPTTASASRGASGPTFGFNMSGTLSRMLTGGWWWWYGGDDEFDVPGHDQNDVHVLRDGDVSPPPEAIDGDHAALRSTDLEILRAQINTSAEMEAIRFFHNLTRNLLTQLDRLLDYKTTSAIFDLGLDDQRRESTPPSVTVTRKDLQQLGLDPVVDGPFVRDVYQVYFDRDVRCPAAHRALGLIDFSANVCLSCCCLENPETSI